MMLLLIMRISVIREINSPVFRSGLSAFKIYLNKSSRIPLSDPGLPDLSSSPGTTVARVSFQCKFYFLQISSRTFSKYFQVPLWLQENMNRSPISDADSQNPPSFKCDYDSPCTTSEVPRHNGKHAVLFSSIKRTATFLTYRRFRWKLSFE